MEAGKLRHRIIVQEKIKTQNPENGEEVYTWEEAFKIWAEIAPLSVRDFVSAQAEQSKVSARITTWQRSDIKDDMRLYHASKDRIYHIEGILDDKNSGLEYMTFAVSEGVRSS